MKKFLAALLAIFAAAALSGCVKPAEGQTAGGITAFENFSETSETVKTETSVSSDNETVEPASGATSETVSETETATEKAVRTEKRGTTFSADAESLLGEWYAIDFISMKNTSVIFGEDGCISLVRDDFTESGTYTVSDGLVEVIYNDGEDWEAYAALFDGDILILKQLGLNQDVIEEDYLPYDDSLSVGEYLYREGNYGMECILSKKKSVLAEQEDILGAWYGKDDDLEGLMIFNGQSVAELSMGDIMDIPVTVRNGKFVLTGEIPKNVSMEEECLFYLCGGKIYMIMCGDDYFIYDDHTLILERYESAALTADMLDGSLGRVSDTYYYFKDGKFYSFTEIADMTGYDFKIDGDKIILPIDGKDVTFKYYILGDDVYLMGEDINIAFVLPE